MAIPGLYLFDKTVVNKAKELAASPRGEKEIADLINESPNTAASRYRYALEKLSRHLQPLVDSARVDIDQPAHTALTNDANEAASADDLKTAKSVTDRSSRQEVPRV